MIYLNQSSFLSDNSNVSINSDSIDSTILIDLDKLNDIRDKVMDKLSNDNLSCKDDLVSKLSTIDIIKETIHNNDDSDSNVDVSVYVADNKNLKFYPNKFMFEDESDIDLSKCLGDGLCAVNVNLIDIANIIAYELVHEDLCETFESMEKKLQDVGVGKVHEADKITKWFNDEDILKIAKELLIGDSPYADYDSHFINDYFNVNRFPIYTNNSISSSRVNKHNHYKEVIEYSCKHAMSIIICSIIKTIARSEMNVVVTGYDEYTICAVVSDNDKEEFPKILNDIVIRAFGRKFRVEPKITYLE